MAETVFQQPQKLSFLNDDLPDSTPSPSTNISGAPESSAFNFPPTSSPNANLVDVNTLGTNTPGISQNPNEFSSSVPGKSYHKRSRTSINKLPAFTFSPGTAVDAPGREDALPSSSPELIPPESPSRGGRHRRSTSELVGGHVGLKSSSSPPMRVDFNSPLEESRQASGNPPARHRHRRSEAMAVQDIPSSVQHSAKTLVQPGLGEASGGTPPLSEHKMERSDSAQRPAYNSAPLNPMDQSESSARVDFAENIEVIPRPLSEASDESGSSASTLKEALHSDMDAVPQAMNHYPESTFDATGPVSTSSDNWGAHDNWGAFHNDGEEASEDQLHFSPESRFVNLRVPDGQAVQLDENFDDDPTSAVTLDEDPPQGEFATKTTSIGEQNTQRTTTEPETGVIDLDLALADHQDLRSSHVRSFQSARRSMHSSAVMSGFLGPGGHYHRRTESAPSLASINFDRHLDGSASEMGFEIQDVFEEEEEEEEKDVVQDEETQQRASPNLPLNEATVEGLGIEGDSKEAGSASQAARLQVQHPTDDASLAPPPPPPHIKGFGNRAVRGKGRYDEDHVLTLPVAAFMTPDTPSSSAFSSPKGQGSSEPSIQFGPSADDVPSLMSSSSTVGSGAPSNYAAGSPAPGSSASTTDVLRSEVHGKKRASVVSLSRLMGGSYSGSERRLADARADKRCQSSDGIPLARTRRTLRLSRMLKFWKGKDAEAR